MNQLKSAAEMIADTKRLEIAFSVAKMLHDRGYESEASSEIGLFGESVFTVEDVVIEVRRKSQPADLTSNSFNVTPGKSSADVENVPSPPTSGVVEDVIKALEELPMQVYRSSAGAELELIVMFPAVRDTLASKLRSIPKVETPGEQPKSTISDEEIRAMLRWVGLHSKEPDEDHRQACDMISRLISELRGKATA